jgi:ABC-type phosphate/phosphonate transport system substrate-binding protein
VWCVINGQESHSGMSALRALIAPLSKGGRLSSDVRVNGAHLESLAMVPQGEADVAAIDRMTLALLARHAPVALAGTRTLCRTAGAIAPPFVSPVELGRPAIRRIQVALLRAFQAPGLAAEREALLLAAIRILPKFSYDEISSLERIACSYGYRELA